MPNKYLVPQPSEWRIGDIFIKAKHPDKREVFIAVFNNMQKAEVLRDFFAAMIPVLDAIANGKDPLAEDQP